MLCLSARPRSSVNAPENRIDDGDTVGLAAILWRVFRFGVVQSSTRKKQREKEKETSLTDTVIHRGRWKAFFVFWYLTEVVQSIHPLVVVSNLKNMALPFWFYHHIYGPNISFISLADCEIKLLIILVVAIFAIWYFLV